MPTNECFNFKYVFIVSVGSVSELFAFCVLYSLRFKDRMKYKKKQRKKTCWPNFLIEIRKFCFSVESFALFVDPKDLSKCSGIILNMNHANSWPISTHRSSIFLCITVRDLCTIHVAFNLMLRQQRRCIELKQKMQKCWLPNRYIEQRMCFLWVVKLRFDLLFRTCEKAKSLRKTTNDRIKSMKNLSIFLSFSL